MTLATHVWFFASIAVRSRVGLLELDGGKEWARDVALGGAPRDTMAAHG
jgi:heme exporter protein C